MKKFLILIISIYLVSCQEKSNIEVPAEKFNVTISQNFEKSITTIKNSPTGPTLSGKEIQLFKKTDGNYVFQESIIELRDNDTNPDKKTPLKLEAGEYLINVIAYKSFYDNWIKKYNTINLNYSYFWNDKRIYNEMYVNKADVLNKRWADCFMAQKEFVVDKNVDINVNATRISSKLRFLSTVAMPDEVAGIIIKINGNRAININTQKAFFKGDYNIRLNKSYFKCIPTNFDYSFHLLEGTTNITFECYNSSAKLISSVVIPEVNLEKGKMITLKGNFFQENGIIVDIEDSNYTNQEIEF